MSDNKGETAASSSVASASLDSNGENAPLPLPKMEKFEGSTSEKFNLIYPKLKKNHGWKYFNGKGLVAWFYALPSVARRDEGTLGVDLFTSEEDVVNYAEKHYPDLFMVEVYEEVAPEKGAGDTEEVDAFEEGHIVEALFRGGSKWYHGVVIKALGGNKYTIKYDDGDEEADVHANLMRRAMPKGLPLSKVVIECIVHLKERSGSSLAGIKKYISGKYGVDFKTGNIKIKLAQTMRKMQVSFMLVKIGARFKLGPKAKTSQQKSSKENKCRSNNRPNGIVKLKEPLAALCGGDTMQAAKVMMKVWKYVKEKNLRCGATTQVKCDGTLRPIFGGLESVDMSAMPQHIHKFLC